MEQATDPMCLGKATPILEAKAPPTGMSGDPKDRSISQSGSRPPRVERGRTVVASSHFLNPSRSMSW